MDEWKEVAEEFGAKEETGGVTVLAIDTLQNMAEEIVRLRKLIKIDYIGDEKPENGFVPFTPEREAYFRNTAHFNIEREAVATIDQLRARESKLQPSEISRLHLREKLAKVTKERDELRKTLEDRQDTEKELCDNVKENILIKKELARQREELQAELAQSEARCVKFRAFVDSFKDSVAIIDLGWLRDRCERFLADDEASERKGVKG